MYPHDFRVRRHRGIHRALFCDRGAQFGDRFFRHPVRELHGWKDGVRVERQRDVARELVGRRPAALARAVPDSIGQDQGGLPGLVIEPQPSRPRQPQLRGARRRVLGDEQILPSALARWRLVVGIEDPVRELVEEHPGADVAFGLLDEDLVEDLLIPLVAGRQRPDHHVQGDQRRGRRDQHYRPEQPVRAHAAGQERHAFAVAGEPPEAYQQPDEEPHRNGDPEGLRRQEQQDLADRDPGHPLRHEALELVHQRRQLQEEREDQDRQQRRRDDLTNHVAVERFQHQRVSQL